jgi:hypothetical protein
MLASRNSQKVWQQFVDLEGTTDRIVSVNDFSQMRDYLMLRLLMASGQRCGALANLTLQQYERGVTTGDLYLRQTQNHNTFGGVQRAGQAILGCRVKANGGNIQGPYATIVRKSTLGVGSESWRTSGAAAFYKFQWSWVR